MTKPKTADTTKKGINTVLYDGLEKMFKDIVKEKDASLVDKMRVADRFLKAEQIRLKVMDDGEGDFFRSNLDEEPNEGANNG